MDANKDNENEPEGATRLVLSFYWGKQPGQQEQDMKKEEKEQEETTRLLPLLSHDIALLVDHIYGCLFFTSGRTKPGSTLVICDR